MERGSYREIQPGQVARHRGGMTLGRSNSNRVVRGDARVHREPGAYAVPDL
jgi:hypothetical protein